MYFDDRGNLKFVKGLEFEENPISTKRVAYR